MDLRKEDLPATIQAFELDKDNEIFIAEQVVNTQAEIEAFTIRYTGKLIKAKKIPLVQTNSHGDAAYKKQRSSTGLIMFIIIVVIIAVVLYGFSTGWIQEKFNLKI